MLFKWPGLFSKDSKTASLVAIFITHSAGQPMQSVDKVTAVANRGLEGDRYLNKTGYWDPVEGCQVTLITEDDLRRAKQGNDLNFAQGEHRRNLLVKGIKTRALEGKTFQIGDAIFTYDKPRPPCGYLDKIQGRGMARALSYNSGICIRVIRGGILRVGDSLKLQN